jgi:hypothetical protein
MAGATVMVGPTVMAGVIATADMDISTTAAGVGMAITAIIGKNEA